jgi:hypothetical protein
MFDELVLRNIIREQKAKYCRFVDTKQWDKLCELLIEWPRLRFYDPDGTLLFAFDSAVEWLDLTSTMLEGARTIHQVHNDEIEFISNEEVRVTWSMEDYIIFAEGGDGPKSLHGWGHYHETWRLIGASWRLSDLELRRTILQIAPR